MAKKSYTVYFACPTIGDSGTALAAYLPQLMQANPSGHFGRVLIDGDHYQLRGMTKVGTVWQGAFARLRSDAPHIVDPADVEAEIALEDGASILDKCHFLYRERGNLLIWQNQLAVASMSKLRYYLHKLLGLYVEVPYCMDSNKLERIMKGDVRALEFSFARPPSDDGSMKQKAGWNRADLALINSVHAAKGQIKLYGTRKNPLALAAKDLIRDLVQRNSTTKITVSLIDEKNPIDLLLAPVKDKIVVRLEGRYPKTGEVFAALEEAYDRQQSHFAKS